MSKEVIVFPIWCVGNMQYQLDILFKYSEEEQQIESVISSQMGFSTGCAPYRKIWWTCFEMGNNKRMEKGRGVLNGECL